nr:SPOCS domain-containing protein [Clostridium aminobutyricum]
MEINETLSLKDTQPKPERILKYDVDIVENHKQITDEKAVINATIYCNVLYLGKVADSEEEAEAKLTPQLFQGKTEFTQFIPISNAAEGSRVAFSDKGIVVRIKEDEAEGAAENAFTLEGEVETSIEIYKNLEREIVTDIYHRTKDLISDKVELETMSLGGSGVTEAAVREIINIPEKYGDVKRVIYISGNIKNSKSTLEQNKNIVEGVVEINLLCIPEDEKKPAFSLTKDLNFRGAMEIPEAKGNTKANSEISIKELWFDRINSKQIEVNANLFIASSIYGQEAYQIIEKVCFVEAQDVNVVKPGMVVYITKTGDTLWDIAKKYRTTVDMITEINDLDKEQKLGDSTKLLIVR